MCVNSINKAKKKNGFLWSTLSFDFAQEDGSYWIHFLNLRIDNK